MDIASVQEKLITLYGEVILSDQERKFFTLGSDFPLMESFDENQIER